MAVVVGLASAISGRALAQDADPVRVAKVKAAYLLNFVRFAQWPDSTFADDAAPITITVIGEPRLLRYLRAIVQDEEVAGRALRVVSIELPERFDDADDPQQRPFLDACRRSHLLYLPRAHEQHVEAVLHAVDDADVLTVSDAPGFAVGGGMLGLAVRDGRVVFDANPGAIDRTRVKVSSKVLKLAQVIVGEDP